MNSHSVRLMGLSLAVPMLTAAALLVAGSASAQTVDADGVTSVAVSYADLNLSQEPGAQAMFQRIKHAAATVCGTAPDLRDAASRAIYDQCRGEAVSHAVAKLNSTLVTEIATAGHPERLASLPMQMASR
jgi:UrcA family protein